MKFPKKTLTTFAALGTILALTTSTASASADGPELCWTSAGNSCVWFKAYGEHVWVWDDDEDGHSAVAQIQIPSMGIYEYAWNHDGYGTVRDRNYDLPEGTIVYYRPCYGEWNGGGGNEQIISCNPNGYAHGTA